jgi:hypothetical protein
MSDPTPLSRIATIAVRNRTTINVPVDEFLGVSYKRPATLSIQQMRRPSRIAEAVPLCLY